MQWFHLNYALQLTLSLQNPSWTRVKTSTLPRALHCSSFFFVCRAISVEGLWPDPFSLQIQVSHHLLQYSKDDANQQPCFWTVHLIHLDYADHDICSLMLHHDFELSLEGTKICHCHLLIFVSLVQGDFRLKGHLIEGLVFKRFSPNDQHYHFD